MIKFTIGSMNWLDSSTLKMFMTIMNDDASQGLYPRSISPNVFFNRVKLLMKGTLIHDITDYNRIGKMFSTLQLHEKRLNHSVMSYGSRVEYFDNWNAHVSDSAGYIPFR